MSLLSGLFSLAQADRKKGKRSAATPPTRPTQPQQSLRSRLPIINPDAAPLLQQRVRPMFGGTQGDSVQRQQSVDVQPSPYLAEMREPHPAPPVPIDVGEPPRPPLDPTAAYIMNGLQTDNRSAFGDAAGTPVSPIQLPKPPAELTQLQKLERNYNNENDKLSKNPTPRQSKVKRFLKGLLWGTLSTGHPFGGVAAGLNATYLNKDYFNHQEDARTRQSIRDEYLPQIAVQREVAGINNDQRQLDISAQNSGIASQRLSLDADINRYDQYYKDKNLLNQLTDNQRQENGQHIEVLKSLPANDPRRDELAAALNAKGVMVSRDSGLRDETVTGADGMYTHVKGKPDATQLSSGGVPIKPRTSVFNMSPSAVGALAGDEADANLPVWDATQERQRAAAEVAKEKFPQLVDAQGNPTGQAVSNAATVYGDLIEQRVRDKKDTFNQTNSRTVKRSRARGTRQAIDQRSGGSGSGSQPVRIQYKNSKTGVMSPVFTSQAEADSWKASQKK